MGSFATPDHNDSDSSPFAPSTESNGAEKAPITAMGISSTCDSINEYEEEALTLPESTHSFLFTEASGSIAYLFGLGIMVMTYACLILALISSLKNSIPENVTPAVRVAQYLSIFIALLMESGKSCSLSIHACSVNMYLNVEISSEIPTGLYLLRRISKRYLGSKLPQASYRGFVVSSIVRIIIGYMFLLNVIVFIVQANEVIEMFYNLLALQFIQELDDIGFKLCKMDVLGKRLQCATLSPFFNVEFKKQRDNLGLKRRVKIFLKGVYFINLTLFLAVIAVVTSRQVTGFYQCNSITVTCE